MKLKDLPKIDLPREKLEKYGREKLADHELLAILLGSGVKGTNVLELSKKILALAAKIGVKKITLSDLCAVKGLGKAKAAQVVAVLELGKRLADNNEPEVLLAKDIWKLSADIRDSKKEHFVAFYLDTRQRLIERQIISIGTLTASLVHPREVFEPAVTLRAASVIVVHNHPSGDDTPSEADEHVTQRLREAGEIIGIKLIDHYILTSNSFRSVS